MKQFVGQLIPIVAIFFTGLSAGVLALIILVWFGGRFIGLAEVSSRLGLIALIVLCFLGWLLARRTYLAKKNNSLETGLKAKTDGSMQKKLDDVMASLKRSGLGSRYRGNSALYALPWYMIIGPSAAGKSTFFSRSGLSFPLNDDKRYHLEGIGGTKDCDWWFSDQAILIDTAGRYSNDKDNAEWLEFLSTLKKNRPKAPVNGVILAFPLDELLTNNDEEAEQHLKHIKNRLHEISQLLGLMVPIYLVITKCDLLKGFESFFEDLSDNEVSQPWGVYMLEDTENKSVDTVAVFKARIQSLYFRLLEQRTQKMSLAQSSQKKSEIYQFPSQFYAASHKLIEFLSLLIKDSPYHESPWFGGLYFTSSMQEGDLLERKSNSIRDVFSRVKSKVLTNQNQPRSYFIKDFFTQVVFPLKDALRGNRKRQNFHRIAKASVFSGLSVMVVIFALVLSGTHSANKKLLASYEKKAVMLIERLESKSSSELEKFDALVGLFNHYESLASIETYSPLHLITRYDLVGTHGEPMRDLLVSTVDSYMSGQVEPYFSNKIMKYNERWPNLGSSERNAMRSKYYNALALYLELTSHRNYYQRNFAADHLAELWFQSFTDDRLLLSYDQQIETIRQLVSLYLEFNFEAKDESQDNYWNHGIQLAHLAQGHLATPPNADLLYQYLIEGANERYSEKTLSDITQGSSDNVLISQASISGVYTKSAWTTYISATIDELSEKASLGDWVLGMEHSSSDEIQQKRFQAQIRQQIRQRYFTDYAKQWRSLVTLTSSIKHRNLVDNINNVREISDPTGPLANLFMALKDNLSIREVTVEIASSTTGETELPVPIYDVPLVAELSLAAQDLLEVIKDADGNGEIDVIENYRAEMETVFSDLEFIAVAANKNAMAREYVGELLSGKSQDKKLYTAWINVKNQLETLEPAENKIVKGVFTQPIVASWQTLLEASEKSVQNSWQNKVYSNYSATLEGKYPFNTKGDDAAVIDFDAMMKPKEGQLWVFLDSDLNEFVVQQGSQWRSKTWLGYGMNFDSSLFVALENASRATNSLYRDSESAQLKVWIYPIAVPGISESTIMVDDNNYHYRNEPQEWREFNWSLNESNSALLSLRSNGVQQNYDIQFQGPWAFARLIQSARVTHIQGTEFAMHWVVDSDLGRPLVGKFHLKADRVGSLLNPNMLSGLSLPKYLFKG